MPEQASVRSGLLLGLLLSLAVLAGVWFGLRGKDAKTHVELLVRCDATDVHRIVGRLRDIDVEVVEVDTRKRLLPSDPMRETPPPAPMASALEVTERIREIAVAVATPEGDPGALQLLALDIGERVAELRVRASRLELLDDLAARIATDPLFVARRRGTSFVHRAAPKPGDGHWDQVIALRLNPPSGDADLGSAPFIETATLHEHVTRHRAILTFATARKTLVVAGGRGRLESQRFQIRIPTLDDLLLLLADLEAEPGMVVTGVQWVRKDAAGAPGATPWPSFTLGCIRQVGTKP